MKIVIGCDVDPVFPALMSDTRQGEVWSCLEESDGLVQASGSLLPRITWLIRAEGEH